MRHHTQRRRKRFAAAAAAFGGYILDDIPGASAAYSLQLLSRDFKSDALIKVRRTSDNAEATVRAFGDEISLNSVITVTSGSSAATTLGEFVAAAGYADVDALGAATSAAMAVWYDQSGNGNHATQSNASRQPLVVIDGTLVLDDAGNPSVKFDRHFLDCGARIVELSQNPATVFCVSQQDIAGTSLLGYICSEGDQVSPYSSNFILGGDDGAEVLWVNTAEFGAGGLGVRLESFLWDEMNFQAYVNGIASGSAGPATVNPETSNTVIGASADGSTAFSGRKIATLISYKNNQSANLSAIHDYILSNWNIS